MIGLTRQTAVLAFQFGDGLSNTIIPTSGILMAMLTLARIPHATWVRFAGPLFLQQKYVYQFATSIIAATKLANDIRAEAGKGGKARPRRNAFLALLSAGSSKYPVDLLKEAGVDMTTSAPFNAAIAEMNAVMDEIEKLLK